MTITNSSPLTLLNLPASLRTTLYDTFIPSGYTIWLGKTTQASIGPWTSLFRTCRQLHTELTEYLSSKPATLFCIAGHRPNILDAIPRSCFSKIEVVIIEDDPEPPLTLGLLPALKCICFCERWLSQYSIPKGGLLGDLSAESVISDPEQVGAIPLLNRAQLLPLPTNNETLKTAHQFWKTLRLEHTWIHSVWRERTDIRVILRRVEELEVIFPPGADHTADEDIIYSSHRVLDVSTRTIIANSYLPTRPKMVGDDGVLFEYGAQNWWKLESEWKGPQRAIA